MFLETRCPIPIERGNSSMGAYNQALGGHVEYTCDTNYFINSTRSKSMNSTCALESDPTTPEWYSDEECVRM